MHTAHSWNTSQTFKAQRGDTTSFSSPSSSLFLSLSPSLSLSLPTAYIAYLSLSPQLLHRVFLSLFHSVCLYHKCSLSLTTTLVCVYTHDCSQYFSFCLL